MLGGGWSSSGLVEDVRVFTAATIGPIEGVAWESKIVALARGACFLLLLGRFWLGEGILEVFEALAVIFNTESLCLSTDVSERYAGTSKSVVSV